MACLLYLSILTGLVCAGDGTNRVRPLNTVTATYAASFGDVSIGAMMANAKNAEAEDIEAPSPSRWHGRLTMMRMAQMEVMFTKYMTEQDSQSRLALMQEHFYMETAALVAGGAWISIQWALWIFLLGRWWSGCFPQKNTTVNYIIKKKDASLERGYTDRNRRACKGHGNCFWRAVAACNSSSSSQKKWRCVKQTVKTLAPRYMHHFDLDDQRAILEALRTGRWVSAPAIRLTAAVFQVKISIYTASGGSRRWKREYEIAPKCATVPGGELHLTYDQHHYECLAFSRASGVLDAVITRTHGPREDPSEADKELLEPSQDQHPPIYRATTRPCQKHSAKEQKMAERSGKQDKIRKKKSQKAKQYPPTQSYLLSRCVSCVGWMLLGWMDVTKVPATPLEQAGRSADASVRPPMRKGVSWGSKNYATRIGGDEPLDTTELQGGGLRTPAGHLQNPLTARGTPRRARTKRIQITLGQETIQVFVQEQTSPQQIAEQAAPHLGVPPQWTRALWASSTNLTLLRTVQPARANALWREHIGNLLAPTRLSRSFRALSDSREVYMGLRTTRQPGLAIATYTHQETLRLLNSHLRRQLPGCFWSAVGVLEHGRVPEHSDYRTQPVSYAASLANGLMVLRVKSPLNNTWVRIPLSGGFVAFDGTRPHAVEGEGRGTTLVLYTPARRPTPAQALELQLLGFPLPQDQVYRQEDRQEALVCPRLRNRPQQEPLCPGTPVTLLDQNNGSALGTRLAQARPPPVTTRNLESASQSSHVHIVTTTTSGNGFEPATPERHSELPALTPSITPTFQDTISEHSSEGPQHVDIDDGHLTGGSKTTSEQGSDNVTRATPEAAVIWFLSIKAWAQSQGTGQELNTDTSTLMGGGGATGGPTRYGSWDPES